MGAIPQILRRSAVRSLLLALLAALAWLVWGAGSATASSLVPDTGDLLEPASSLLAGPSPLPAPPAVPSAGDAAIATAASLTDSATGAVNTLAAPALPVVGGAVDIVTDLAPPDLPLVQAPLPLPLTDVLPLPEQLPPLLTEPLPLPDLLPVPVPTPLPGLPPLTTPAPGPVPAAALSHPASDAVADKGVAAAPSGPVRTEPEPEALAAEPAVSTLRFGFTPAQDSAGFASPPEATANPSGSEDGTVHPNPPAPLALENEAGQANSGSSGSVGAADVAWSWPAFPTTTTGPNLSGNETLPTGPSFDPGSSPD